MRINWRVGEWVSWRVFSWRVRKFAKLALEQICRPRIARPDRPRASHTQLPTATPQLPTACSWAASAGRASAVHGTRSRRRRVVVAPTSADSFMPRPAITASAMRDANSQIDRSIVVPGMTKSTSSGSVVSTMRGRNLELARLVGNLSSWCRRRPRRAGGPCRGCPRGSSAACRSFSLRDLSSRACRGGRRWPSFHHAAVRRADRREVGEQPAGHRSFT